MPIHFGSGPVVVLPPSGEYTRPPMARRRHDGCFWLGAATLVLAAAILIGVAYIAPPSTEIAHARASAYTNALFLWPALLALLHRADGTAVIFVVTLVASALHHGCTTNDAVRAALAAESFVLLGVSALVLIAGGAAIMWARAGAVLADDAATRSRARALVLGLAAAAGVAALVLLGLALSAVAADTLDACISVHAAGSTTHVVPLARLWAVVDFAAAFAGLAAAAALLLQANVRHELGAGWALLLLVLVLVSYREDALLTTTAMNVALAAALLGLMGLRLALCCCVAPAAVRADTLGRYRLGVLVVAGALAVGALALFLALNTAASHALWHVLAAAALYAVIAARRYVHRDRLHRV